MGDPYNQSGVWASPLLYDKYHNYQMAFYTAAVLEAVALICELSAKRPAVPERRIAGSKAPAAA